MLSRLQTAFPAFTQWKSLFQYKSNPNLFSPSLLHSTLSLFLPSRPPPTPACYLHPPLPRAALTHRRTPPLICRLRPRPTPTPVSVSEVDVGLFNRGGDVYFMSVCYLWLPAELTVSVFLLLPLFHPGLISPGVSVPVQVPGTEQQGMSHNLGQYWARLQWTTDNRCQLAKQKKKGEKKGM